MKNLVILISGNGSNMKAIIKACENESWPARIVAVISDKHNSSGMHFALNKKNIKTVLVERNKFISLEEFNIELIKHIDYFSPDLIILAGFMSILTEKFINHFCGNILNIHPSLLPSFPGLNTHERAIASGSHVHGASVHFVTEIIDHGPIVAQAIIPIIYNDNVESLKLRTLKAEHIIYPKSIYWFIMNRIIIDELRVRITPTEKQLFFFNF